MVHGIAQRTFFFNGCPVGSDVTAFGYALNKRVLVRINSVLPNNKAKQQQPCE